LPRGVADHGSRRHAVPARHRPDGGPRLRAHGAERTPTVPRRVGSPDVHRDVLQRVFAGVHRRRRTADLLRVAGEHRPSHRSRDHLRSRPRRRTLSLLLWPLLAAPFFPGLVAANAVLRGLLGAAVVAAAVIAALFFVAGSPRALGSSIVAAVLAR